MSTRRAAALFSAVLFATLGLPGCTREPPQGASPQPSASASAEAAPEASLAQPAPEVPRPKAAPREIQGKIVCFGDSITQAEWPGKIDPKERWVTQLGLKSAAIQAVNAGKNGRQTTAIDELDKALTANADAAIVLLFLGVNDMKHASVGVVEQATSDMGRMIDLARKKIPSAEVVLCAPININVDKLTPYFKGEGLGPDTAHFMRALAITYATLAKKKGVRFINLLHAVTPEYIEDGVHANGKGQIQIADAVWKGLLDTSTPIRTSTPPPPAAPTAQTP